QEPAQEDRARSRKPQAHRHGVRARIQVRMTRLRWKLLAAMVALIGVTLAVSGLFTRQGTHDQVRRVLVAHPPDAERVAGPPEEHRRQAGDWRGVDAVIDQTAAALGCRLVLVAPQGEVIAVSADLRAARVAVDPDDRVTAVLDRGGRLEQLAVRIAPRVLHDATGRAVARAYILPGDDPEDPAVRAVAAVDRRVIAIFA